MSSREIHVKPQCEIEEILYEARAFAEANVSECAEEMLEWTDTNPLCDGKLRELAAILRQVMNECAALVTAGDMVKDSALRVAARVK